MADHVEHLLAPLLALVAKWRERGEVAFIDDEQVAIEQCADELQAAIDSLAAHRGEVSGDVAAALDAVYDDFCAKDNGDVPLERYPQGAVDALARAGWAVVPCNLPHKVLGNAAVTGVLETGNPKHCWDYLIAHTRIYPNQPLPPQAQAGAGDAEDRVDVALTAYNRAYYQWTQRDKDDRDEPRHRFAMRAAVAALEAK